MDDNNQSRRSFRLPLRGTFSDPDMPKPPVLSSTHTPPRPSSSLSLISPTSSPPTTRSAKPSTTKYVHYTLDPGPRHVPGTATYYKSSAFRQKKLKGDVQVPGGDRDAGVNSNDNADDNDDDNRLPKTSGTRAKSSSVLVFSHTGVRKASSKRKVDERKKRASRRKKTLRRMEGPIFTNPKKRPAPKIHGPIAYWQYLASSLLSGRNNFAASNEPIDNPRCSNIDRSAVLAVYNEAITRLEHVSEHDARRIENEGKLKISTILDIRTAQPEDEVFFSATAFLSPLEPQYAQPRVDYYDRGGVDEDDSYGRVAGMRLREWRREGWPRKYPRGAVEKERRQRAARRRQGKKGREEAEEALVRVLKEDEEWGDVVEADSERLWR
ncbi:hypothetical protein E8E13_008916 [Curvularia kusanoi]|uniref:Uncharacterized protein n=1 Tax=Curvularia kusanoi TaxID=90978 RepID=A0A9P4TH50_CURKU|nr:hypothetical protein E8E13_008916 [Curvularia kusanoi]